jgi:AcrR family transcriptional regulator
MTMLPLSEEAPRKPGRPRSAQAHHAILQATLTLLAEVGLQSLSIERVAARAGVGKKTIYRRWSSKEALVSAAIQSLQAEMPVVDTGNLRVDLLAMYRTALYSLTAAPVMRPLYLKLAAEYFSHPAIFEVFVAQLIVPRFQQFTRLVEQAQSRGEIRQDLDRDVVVDILLGPMVFRWLFMNVLRPAPSPAEADLQTEQLVDLVLGWLADHPKSPHEHV